MGMELPRQCVQSLGIVQHGLADTLADGLLQLRAVLGRHLPQDLGRPKARGLGQQPLMQRGRHGRGPSRGLALGLLGIGYPGVSLIE